MFRILKAVFLAIVVLNLNLGPAWAQSTEAGREQAIKDALARTPPPTTLPQEAERRFFRGLAAMKVASSVEDFESAAREFDMATVAAPWYADAYYNAGIAHNKAGNYSAARRNFSFYLLAAPAAPDTAEVKAMVYENEYLAEREEIGERERREAEAEVENETARLFRSLAGRWYLDNGDEALESIWALLPTGKNSFELKFEVLMLLTDGSRYNEDQIEIYELKVTGYRVEGIRRFAVPLYSERCGFTEEVKAGVTGNISDNGKTISLTIGQHSNLVVLPNCSWRTRQESTKTFRKG